MRGWSSGWSCLVLWLCEVEAFGAVCVQLFVASYVACDVCSCRVCTVGLSRSYVWFCDVCITVSSWVEAGCVRS